MSKKLNQSVQIGSEFRKRSQMTSCGNFLPPQIVVKEDRQRGNHRQGC